MLVPGGIAHEVLQIINQQNLSLSYFLTDKYPNIKAFSELKKLFPNKLDFSTESIDATKIPSNLKGLRIFCTSFHHFPQKIALEILEDAVNKSEPIAILEVTERSLLKIFQVVLASSIWLWLITPFLKPLFTSKIILDLHYTDYASHYCMGWNNFMFEIIYRKRLSKFNFSE